MRNRHYKVLDETLNALGALVFMFGFFFPWFYGVVIAKGFWSTFFSILFFPYSWYLVTEHLVLNGFLP